jgi:hypothetical protein
MKINCNNCGNLLEINADTAFVSCLRCEANLLVVRSENSVYTKLNTLDQSPFVPNPAAQPAQSTPTTAEIYAAIQLLDNEWDNNLSKAKYDSPSDKPNYSIYIVFALLTIVGFIGIIWTLINQSFSGTLSMVSMLVIAIAFAVNTMNKSAAYIAAKKEYEERRAKLMSKLPKI